MLENHGSTLREPGQIDLGLGSLKLEPRVHVAQHLVREWVPHELQGAVEHVRLAAGVLVKVLFAEVDLEKEVLPHVVVVFDVVAEAAG